MKTTVTLKIDPVEFVVEVEYELEKGDVDIVDWHVNHTKMWTLTIPTERFPMWAEAAEQIVTDNQEKLQGLVRNELGI